MKTAYAAAFGALLFGVHPFFSSSTAYIYARGSMMAAMFVFAAILAALKLRGLWPWVVVPGLLACGVLSKEEALIAPALFLGYAIIHRKWSAAAGLTVAMVFGLVALLLLTPHVQTIANTGWNDNIKPAPDLILNYGAWPTVGQHLRGVVSGYVFHMLGNLVLPIHLTPDPSMVFDWRWIAALLVIVVMSAAALSAKIPVDIRLALWALLCCPILGATVILVAEPMFEYRAYILGLGVALMGGALALRLQRLRMAPVLAALTIAILAAGTVQRNQVWSNTIDLWTDANQKDPAKKRAVLNLSSALLKAKRDIEAERVLLDSLVIYPTGFKAAHVNLAAIYIENRKFDAGEFHARLGTPVPLAYVYIALTQAAGGHYEDALANAKTAIEMDPEMVYAESIRLSVLEAMGKTSEEITRLEEKVSLHPRDRMAHATLSMAYRIAGFKEGAEEHKKIAETLAKEN